MSKSFYYCYSASTNEEFILSSTNGLPSGEDIFMNPEKTNTPLGSLFTRCISIFVQAQENMFRNFPSIVKQALNSFQPLESQDIFIDFILSCEFDFKLCSEFIKYIEACCKDSRLCTSYYLAWFANTLNIELPQKEMRTFYLGKTISSFQSSDDILQHLKDDLFEHEMKVIINRHPELIPEEYKEVCQMVTDDQYIKKAHLVNSNIFRAYNCYRISQFSDIIASTFQEAFTIKKIVRQCQQCGRYFVPENRNDNYYCSNLCPKNLTLTCPEMAIRENDRARYHKDEALRISKQISSSIHQRADSAKWAEKIRMKILELERTFRDDNCIFKKSVSDGTKSQEEYIGWLKKQKTYYLKELKRLKAETKGQKN